MQLYSNNDVNGIAESQEVLYYLSMSFYMLILRVYNIQKMTINSGLLLSTAIFRKGAGGKHSRYKALLHYSHFSIKKNNHFKPQGAHTSGVTVCMFEI